MMAWKGPPATPQTPKQLPKRQPPPTATNHHLQPPPPRYGAQELFHDEVEGAPGDTTDPQAAAEAAAAAARAKGATGAAVTEAAATAAAAAAARGRRIMWDDSAIERLLDRSDLLQGKATGGEGAAAEEGNEDDEFTKAFKVANFEMVEQEEEEEEEGAGEEGAGEGDGEGGSKGGGATKGPEEMPAPAIMRANAANFWGGVLGDKIREERWGGLSMVSRVQGEASRV